MHAWGSETRDYSLLYQHFSYNLLNVIHHNSYFDAASIFKPPKLDTKMSAYDCAAIVLTQTVQRYIT